MGCGTSASYLFSIFTVPFPSSPPRGTWAWLDVWHLDLIRSACSLPMFSPSYPSPSFNLIIFPGYNSTQLLSSHDVGIELGLSTFHGSFCVPIPSIYHMSCCDILLVPIWSIKLLICFVSTWLFYLIQSGVSYFTITILLSLLISLGWKHPTVLLGSLSYNEPIDNQWLGRVSTITMKDSLWASNSNQTIHNRTNFIIWHSSRLQVVTA